MWLLLCLTILFAGFSQAMMSFLVMHWSMGPWFGPIFVVVCMALVIPFISRKWFQEHAMVTIATGSIGGMVGLCLGMTIPAFYFLHKGEFLTWIMTPVWFAGVISLLVFCAGLLAFFITYLIKDHFIGDDQLPFPVAKLVYDIVSLEQYAPEHQLMWIGVGISTLWNSILFAFRFALQAFIMNLQIIPLLFSVGFMAGHLVTIPAIIGIINRLIALDILHAYFFEEIPSKEFLVMFCLGMLVVQILYSFFLFISWFLHRNDDVGTMRVLIRLKDRLLDNFFGGVVIVLLSSILLCALGVHVYELLFVFPVLILIALNVARIVGVIGIIDINGFVWCVLLPLLYCSDISSLNVLLVATFVTLCLGMVIDLIFSYKLTRLAQISYSYVLRYQMIAFFVVVITSGIVMWYYAQAFTEQSLSLVASDAQDLDSLINFGVFNYKIFMSGMLSGLLVLFSRQSLLGVVGLTLMIPYHSMWLIIAGAISFLVVDRRKLYPLWFGVYAAHAFWMIVWAIL